MNNGQTRLRYHSVHEQVSPAKYAKLFHSSAKDYIKSTRKAKGKSQKKVESAMREVFTHEPSTVTRANVSGERKRKMKMAIAFAKARKAGARVPKK